MRDVARNFSAAVALALWIGCALGCEDSGKLSARYAQAHVEQVAGFVARDVDQVRKGLPEGVKQLVPLWRANEDPLQDPQAVKRRLERNRDRVFELSIAKSTFFAVATPDGLIVRSDQDVDAVAGKNLFEPFPALRSATERYTEATGNMVELFGVKGKPDGQWLAAEPIKVEQQTKGIYVTGWSWARYCYSLEEGLRSAIRSSLVDDKGRLDKEPLIYVFLIADGQVYGAPASPQFNADAIAKLDLLAKLPEQTVFAEPLEIDRRSFGLAAKRTPDLGKDVAVAVLRSET